MPTKQSCSIVTESRSVSRFQILLEKIHIQKDSQINPPPYLPLCGLFIDSLEFNSSTAYCALRNKTKENEICSLRNENLYFAKLDKVLCLFYLPVIDE